MYLGMDYYKTITSHRQFIAKAVGNQRVFTGCIGAFVTVHQFGAAVEKFFLSTGRVPGWSPTLPLASCHRHMDRAISGPICGSLGSNFGPCPAGREQLARPKTNF